MTWSQDRDDHMYYVSIGGNTCGTESRAVIAVGPGEPSSCAVVWLSGRGDGVSPLHC